MSQRQEARAPAAPPRRRPDARVGDVRSQLAQLLADLAAESLWLPARHAWEKERATRAMTRLVGDLARTAVTVRAFPACPPDWPGYSHAAAVALAAAIDQEPDLAAWLAEILASLPRGRGDQLAAALAAAGDRPVP